MKPRAVDVTPRLYAQLRCPCTRNGHGTWPYEKEEASETAMRWILGWRWLPSIVLVLRDSATHIGTGVSGCHCICVYAAVQADGLYYPVARSDEGMRLGRKDEWEVVENKHGNRWVRGTHNVVAMNTVQRTFAFMKLPSTHFFSSCCSWWQLVGRCLCALERERGGCRIEVASSIWKCML